MPTADTVREIMKPTAAAVTGTSSRAAVPHAEQKASMASPRKRAFWNGNGVRGMLRKLNTMTHKDRTRFTLRMTSPNVWEIGRTGSRFTA